MTPRLRRRFVTVQGRTVHYLRLGEGPPAVLVHSSPVNAWYVLPQMRMLASRFTCFAFDNPGYGLSQPLPGDELKVADLSQALAENMAALALPRCPVFGTHTGAAIAVSLAAHHPERVTALMIDAVPIFTDEERARLFEGYFETLQPELLGGHFSSLWTRFRDQYVWFPWTQKTPDRHNEIDLGNADALHAWLMSFFYAGRTYKAAYRAAVGYGEQAITDTRALQCPAIFTASETDMLHSHMARLPALRADQAIRAIGVDKDAKDALIAEVFNRWPATEAAPATGFSLAPGPQLQQQFVDLPDDQGAGQMLLRFAGPQPGLNAQAQAPTLLLLHDAPGCGRQHEALVQALAQHHRVLAPDLPGCGGSDPLPQAAAAGQDAGPTAPQDLSAWADAVAAACAAAGVQQASVYGIGIGSALALVLAKRHPALAQAVLLNGVALPDPDQRAELLARYAPPITLQADGSHWYRTWLMLRDRQIWFPWYDTRARQLRRVPADFGADGLHEHTFDVMKQHASYHQLILAALAHDAEGSLATLQQPLALCDDPRVPFFAYQARLKALRPGAALLPVDADFSAHAAAVAGFLSTTR